MNQQAATQRNLALISRRECTLIACLADGYTHKQIGDKLGLSESVVQQNLQELMHKQGAQHSFELISWAYLNGFLK